MFHVKNLDVFESTQLAWPVNDVILHLSRTLGLKGVAASKRGEKQIPYRTISALIGMYESWYVVVKHFVCLFII